MDLTEEGKQSAHQDGQDTENDDTKIESEQVIDNETDTDTENTAKKETPGHCTDEKLDEIKADLSSVAAAVNGIADSAAKTAKETYELHKLYHNEYAKRLASMQEELERYRKVDSGRIFDGILIEIAKLYSDNALAINDIADEKIQKRFRNMFLDMLQILENNGVCKQESKPGEKRNTRHCQVVDRVHTDDSALHDTIVKSVNVGFYIENRTLIKEMVHVYICKNADSQSAADNQSANN